MMGLVEVTGDWSWEIWPPPFYPILHDDDGCSRLSFFSTIVDDTSGWHRSFLPAITHYSSTMYSDLSLVASCSTSAMCEGRFPSLFSFLVLHQIEGGRKRAFAYVIYT